MTVAENMVKFKDAIQSVADYAKKTGFDIDNGDIDVLMNDWINYTKKMYDSIEGNKDEAIRIFKQLIEKNCMCSDPLIYSALNTKCRRCGGDI